MQQFHQYCTRGPLIIKGVYSDSEVFFEARSLCAPPDWLRCCSHGFIVHCSCFSLFYILVFGRIELINQGPGDVEHVKDWHQARFVRVGIRARRGRRANSSKRRLGSSRAARWSASAAHSSARHVRLVQVNAQGLRPAHPHARGRRPGQIHSQVHGNSRYTAATPSAGSNPALTNTAGLNRPKQCWNSAQRLLR